MFSLFHQLPAILPIFVGFPFPELVPATAGFPAHPTTLLYIPLCVCSSFCYLPFFFRYPCCYKLSWVPHYPILHPTVVPIFLLPTLLLLQVFFSLQIRCPSNPPSASILLHVGCSSHSHSLSSCLRCRLFRDWPIFLNVANTLDSPPGFLAPLRNSLGSY